MHGRESRIRNLEVNSQELKDGINFGEEAMRTSFSDVGAKKGSVKEFKEHQSSNQG